MHDKNLDSEGYLTYTEGSSSVRQAVAKALREIDLHSNGNALNWSEDLIYGRRGDDRTDYFTLTGDHYTYTQLAVFLFNKGFLKVLVEDEPEDFLIDAKIIFPEYNRESFKQKIPNINGPQFQKHINGALVGNYIRVTPLRKFEPYQHKNILFSTKISFDEIVTYNSEYYLIGPDIIFPKNYKPFVQ